MTDQYLPNQGAPFTAVSVTLASGSQIQVVLPVCGLITNVDETGPNYIGYALRGAADSDAAWFIVKTTEAAGVTTTRFASAPFVMDQIWNDRASLSYS